MDKEEILQASRKENQNKDIYELEITRKGQRIGGLAAICIAFILINVDRLRYDAGTNYGYFMILTASAAGMFIYKAIKLKQKHEILVAMIWTLATIYTLIMYILS
jgi:hypothetical protein